MSSVVKTNFATECKELMLAWIDETFTKSRDVFEYTPYQIKHWMEEEIGVYATEDEFRAALGFYFKSTSEQKENKNDHTIIRDRTKTESKTWIIDTD